MIRHSILNKLKPTGHTQSIVHARPFSSSHRNHADFTHAIIGGGAVGLAVARQLAISRPNGSTILIERHGMVGSETSSRNSEVIHAGLYYGHGTLKTELCIQGREMMYDLCRRQNIPHRNTKKWIVAQDDQQMGELEKVRKFANELGYDRVPTRFLSRQEIKDREPDVRAEAGVLESESTGIVDSHSFMAYLEGDFLEKGGEMALHSVVTGIERDPNTGNYKLRIRTASDDSHHKTNTKEQEEDTIEVETVINSAGLNAIPISNLLLLPHLHRKPFYAKGSYFSYASRHPKPKTLLYPAPVPGLGGLGTHLTLDMTGRVRFGPDVEWTEDPTDLAPNSSRLSEAIEQIKTYLPGIDESAIDLDYCGIRPKLGRTSGTAGPSFADFIIREENVNGFPGFVNLLGIESPGLTASLAIGKHVDGILYGSENNKIGAGKSAEERGKGPRFEFHH